MAILTDDNYVDKAEKTVKSLEKDKRNFKQRGADVLSMSKIRGLLSLTSNLFDESRVREYENLKDKIAYLRVQFVYQAGREPAVEDLVQKGQLLEALKEVRDKESLQRFCRYMEALVAYFKFYGGKD